MAPLAFVTGSGVSVAWLPYRCWFTASWPSSGRIAMTAPIRTANAAPASRAAFQVPKRALSRCPSQTARISSATEATTMTR